MTAVFITATGTDIGKTFVARGMIHQLRARGRSVEALKPVITGFDPRAAAGERHRPPAAGARPDADAGADRAMFRPTGCARRSPPTSPRAREGARIDFAALVAHCRRAIARHRDALIIEGIGGIMVPLDERHTVLDWMVELDLPLILAAGSYVGTLSHTLSALDVLDRNGLKVAAVVVNETPGSAAGLDDTASTIRRFAAGIEVFVLPRLPEGVLEHPVMAWLADMM